jgi:hypothetical protein
MGDAEPVFLGAGLAMKTGSEGRDEALFDTMHYTLLSLSKPLI